MRSYLGMDSLFIPKKFEIQFRKNADDLYTGVLLVDGMEMSIGGPKTLEEITAFLMPQRRPTMNQLVSAQRPSVFETEFNHGREF